MLTAFCSNIRFKDKNPGEAGVTLLISILVMASLALVSLAVAAFTIQEIRSSRAVVLTESAIGAAETAGEQGLWAIKRGVALSACPAQTTVSLSNGALVNSCKSHSSAVFDLEANTDFVFYLYNPDNINGDIDLSEYPYTWLDVNSLSGSFQISITVVHIDGSSNNISPSASSVNPGEVRRVQISQVPENTEGRMQVTLRSAGSGTVSVNTNQGMPNFPTIIAGGCSAKVAVSDCGNTSQDLYSRQINISVPQ